MSRPEALRRARALREQLRESREVFSQSTYREQLLLLCGDLGRSALEGLVDWAAEYVDRHATRDRDRDQEPSLPGVDLAGDYHLGAGERIAKKYARLEHIVAALQLDDANLAVCQEANARKHDELERLRPYLGPGVTKEQAAAAYWSDHGAA